MKTKSFFAYIKSKQKVKDREGPLKDIDGNVITKSVDIAESLNHYFSSVFTLEDKGKLPTIPQMMGENEACIQHMVITPDMILAKLKKMKDNKSPGVDGISPKMLKEIAEEISVPLAMDGIVPLEWKIANVVGLPISSKWETYVNPENYRPVSLTSVICKLFESLLRDHMVEFTSTT